MLLGFVWSWQSFFWKSHDFRRRGQRRDLFLNLIVCSDWLKVLGKCKVFSCAWIQGGDGVFWLFCAICYDGVS